MLGWVGHAPATVVGCLNNARAVAEAALEIAAGLGTRVGIVCAGTLGVFALDDAVAAGVIVERLLATAAARGIAATTTEPAVAAVQLRASYADEYTPLRGSVAGHLLHRLGVDEDTEFCARVDVTATVPILRPGRPLMLERYVPAGAPAG